MELESITCVCVCVCVLELFSRGLSLREGF